MAGIAGGVRSVRQIFKDDYAIGDFQRGYTWQHDHAAMLVTDLARAYEGRREPDVSGDYYLGAVVTHNRFGFHHIVDGQQRLTTLLLFLIWLYHELAGRDRRREAVLESLVRHDTPSRAAFAIDVSEREPVLRTLFDNPEDLTHLTLENDTDRTIVDRYMTIGEVFPDELRGDRLAGFIDWMLDRVLVIKVEVEKESDAYTVFETTNDRGQKLGTAQLLKNFLQARIEDPDLRDRALSQWTQSMRELQRFGAAGDVDFVVQWLKARYAQLPVEPDRTNDLKAIDKDHFGWARDNAARMGLTSSDRVLRFMTEEFALMNQMYVRVRDGAKFPERGLDSLYFLANLKTDATQYTRTLVLAGVDPDAPEADTLSIMRASATFAEIFAARQAWQSLHTATLGKERSILEKAAASVRDVAPKDAVAALTALAQELPYRFADTPDPGMPRNAGPRPRQIVHSMLARMSACFDEAFGDTAAYPRYEIRSAARGYTIEHVLPSEAAAQRNLFETSAAYSKRRNKLGALLLLRASDNQKLGDAEFSERVETYGRLSRLARTFHPDFYSEEVRRLLAALKLDFAPCETFGSAELEIRQAAYLRLAELTWSVDRIAFAARPQAGDDARVYALPTSLLGVHR